MLRDVGQRRVTADGVDPRVAELRAAVSRLRRELAGHRREFADRGIAEDELAALDAMAVSGAPEIARLRRSLLLVAGAVGSVSALAEGLAGVRRAVDLFGPPSVPGPRDGHLPWDGHPDA
ncbi:DUF5955 family protein [Streptomyces sp. NPDC048623]|uniref:DUF5955 family protein n=1 Tax=Streptomyces sp. NPDC048623 TaxID=3155761 RepID=UPI0034388CB4